MSQSRDELDLHGLTVDEAIPRIDDFLYESFQTGMGRVLIVHGKGSGVLRQAVGRYLANHPLVKAYKTADAASGGVGATQVILSEL